MAVKVHRNDVNRVRQLKVGHRSMTVKELISFLQTLPSDSVFVTAQSMDKKNSQLFFQSSAWDVVDSTMEVPEFEVSVEASTSKKKFKESSGFADMLAGI